LLCDYFCLLQGRLILMTRFTSFNDLPGLRSVFFISFLKYFFHFYHLTLTYWAISFVIYSPFLFVGLSPFYILCRRFVGLTCLDSIFCRLIFYLILFFSIKLLTFKCCHCFHLWFVILKVSSLFSFLQFLKLRKKIMELGVFFNFIVIFFTKLWFFFLNFTPIDIFTDQIWFMFFLVLFF
jgi:hypothetical protein